MAALEIALKFLVGVALLLAVTMVCRSRSLPPPPTRLGLMALLSWALLALFPAELVPLVFRPWVELSDNLLLAFTAIRLLLWVVLELPGSLRWWPSPPELLVQLLTMAGWTVAAVLVVRQNTRFDLVNLVATSAVLTAVIGLAAQQGLKDLFSGLELQLANNFALGDWIELPDGKHGIICGFSWREIQLRTLDDRLMLVPNSLITAGIVVHRSHFGFCGDRFEVGLDYDFPPGRALPLLQQLVEQHPLVLSDPAPRIRVNAFLDSSISYEVQIWQRGAGERARLELRSDLLNQIWYGVMRQGQSFPFPVQELRPRRSSLPPEQLQQPTVDNCRAVLALVPMFADLSDAELTVLVDDCQLLTYGPGEAVVREGAEGHSLFCLLHGRVDVCKQMEDGRQVSVSQLKPGDVFGEMTLFLDTPRSATVRTLEESRLLRVGRPAVRRLLELNPALLERIAALVSARQAELEQLSREQMKGHSLGLLETMRRLFDVVSGSSGGL
jgi:hypothetical protein